MSAAYGNLPLHVNLLSLNLLLWADYVIKWSEVWIIIDHIAIHLKFSNPFIFKNLAKWTCHSVSICGFLNSRTIVFIFIIFETGLGSLFLVLFLCHDTVLKTLIFESLLIFEHLFAQKCQCGCFQIYYWMLLNIANCQI